MLETLMNGITWVFNFLLNLVGGALNLIVSVLPNSPFKPVITYAKEMNISEYLAYLSWLLPIGYILSITAAWVACVSVYYLYSIIMRWIKMIE